MRHHMLLALLLLLPALARADVWRWRDAEGRIRYSDDRSHVPRGAVRLRADIGRISTPPLVAAKPADVRSDLRAYERADLERRIERRLADIDCFSDSVRARQAARLLEFGGANATLLPDWAVADRWMAARSEEGWLWSALRDLDARKPPGY